MANEASELTVGAVTRHFARIAPGKRALYDGERSLTYGQLDDQAHIVASAMVRAGVRHGDVVCAYLPNSIDYVVVVLAAARSGAIFSPINPRYKGFEVGAILRQARPRVLFTTLSQVANVRKMASELGQPQLRVVT
ncbi:MAG TPA: AMP-binding protein, partial [Usitatibacter sp.]|nr:AMP-binding protein [Usitatibacter sp.]